MAYQAVDPIRRFWAKTPKGGDSSCWIWQGYRDRNGYGRLTVEKSPKLASRLSWEINRGPIPAGMCVCHKCDTPSCVNPNHLFLGDHQANMTDMARKRRARGQRQTHCANGHEFTESNTIIRANGTARTCRECGRIAQRKYEKRKRSK